MIFLVICYDEHIEHWKNTTGIGYNEIIVLPIGNFSFGQHTWT